MCLKKGLWSLSLDRQYFGYVQCVHILPGFQIHNWMVKSQFQLFHPFLMIKSYAIPIVSPFFVKFNFFTILMVKSIDSIDLMIKSTFLMASSWSNHCFHHLWCLNQSNPSYLQTTRQPVHHHRADFPVRSYQVGVFPVKQRLSDEVASKVVAVGVKSVLDGKMGAIIRHEIAMKHAEHWDLSIKQCLDS